MADMDYNYSGDIVTGVEPAKKCKGTVIGGITAGVLVVAVGGGIAAYNFSDLVKNQVKLAINKPDDYYTWVTEKNTSEFATQITEAYRTYIEEQKKGTTSNIVLNFDLSEEAKDLLSEEDEDFPEINSVSLGISSKLKNKTLNSDVYAEINDNNIINTEVAADYNSEDIFLRFPELSEQWILLSSVIDETELEEIKPAVTDIESIITPEELESLIVKYADLYNSCISDIEIEKREEIAISDITVTYTVAEMTLTEEKTDEIAEKFLNEIKNDELIKDILIERTKLMTEEDFNLEIEESLLDSAEDSEAKDIVIKTYIDATGCIRGISATDAQNAENDMRFIIGQQETAIRGEFYLSEENSVDDTRMDIALTENGDKSYDGTITILAEGDEISAEISDFTIVDKKKCYMTGNISVSTEEETFSLALSTEDNAQIISSDINVEGTNYGKLSIKLSAESGTEPTIPDKSAAYDIYSDEADFPKDYVEQDKMVEFAKNVLINIGLDEKTADEYAVEFGDSIYYTYDTWEEDFDYDWDDEIIIDTEDEDLYWEDFESNDLYADDIAYPDENEAYIIVMDKSGAASYAGYHGALAYNAKFAEITGAGTYTVSVTADTEGYREYVRSIINEEKLPDGFDMLGINVDSNIFTEDTKITIKSVKVDGKEISITAEPEIIGDEGILSILLYLGEDTFGSDIENCLDLRSIGEWTDVEITFEVK
ncbi:MAG: hypothetical protein IKV85_01835 [Ruminococcus sp.]|nr:hypothetical protein [Ruminococcus sp.]